MADATARGFIRGIGLQWSMLENYQKSPTMFDTY